MKLITKTNNGNMSYKNSYQQNTPDTQTVISQVNIKKNRPYAIQFLSAVALTLAASPFAFYPQVVLANDGNTISTDTSTSQSHMPQNLNEWFERSDRVKENQPHWMTPLATVTPRLEQEYRYDQLWQNKPKGVSLENYGLNKGLELITSENAELILGVPGYVKETSSKEDKEGFADASLLLKYRFISANEENGNYIVTGFLGLTVPTGSANFTTGHTVLTSTIAAGKGWGTREQGFDIQSTLAISYADGNQQKTGEPIMWNTTFQAHIGKIWPEIETNVIHFNEGINAGKTQTVITTGFNLGRFHLYDRLNLAIGAGYQQTVSSFKTVNNGLLLTARLPF